MVQLEISPTSPKWVHIRVDCEVSVPRLGPFREWLRNHGFPDPFTVLNDSSITLTVLEFQSGATASLALALLQEHEHEIDALEDVELFSNLIDTGQGKESMDEIEFAVGHPFFLLLSPLPTGQSFPFVVSGDTEVTPSLLFALIDMYFPHRDTTKPIQWKSMDGDLISVNPYAVDENWKEAILDARRMTDALDEPGRVTLKVYVVVLETVCVRYVNEVLSLKMLAAAAVAKVVNDKQAVDKLPIPETLKPTIEKEVDFFVKAGSNTVVHKRVTAVLDI